jgi:hypothetical protein
MERTASPLLDAYKDLIEGQQDPEVLQRALIAVLEKMEAADAQSSTSLYCNTPDQDDRAPTGDDYNAMFDGVLDAIRLTLLDADATPSP